MDLNEVISEALDIVMDKYLEFKSYSEISLPKTATADDIESTDIPPGHYIRLPDLALEQYEKIVDDTSWEYLDGILFHHSPESHQHDAILNLLIYRAMSNLDPNSYIIRTSRVAVSIDQDKPEPDFMVFNKKEFRKMKRKDGSESEITESAPLLVIEIVSKSTQKIDELKKKKYLHKGIKEFWRIIPHEEPMRVIVCSLKEGKYESLEYLTGEIRSRVLPDFAITFSDLQNPDSAR